MGDTTGRFATFRYIDTYYLCSCIKGIIENPFDYLRFFDDLWCDGKILNYVDGFRKTESGLEIFIADCLWQIYEELTAHVSESEILDRGTRGTSPKLTIEVLFDAYGIPHRTFKDAFDKDGISPDEYFYGVEAEMRSLTEYVSREVLNVLFFDRSFLKKFNELLADHLKDFVEGHSEGESFSFSKEIESLFSSRGRLKRKCPPKWLQRAVYYREHGCCTICQADLSGLLTNLKNENFDHIVPLDKFGANDVGNIQLLCSPCNAKKKAKSSDTSDVYVALW